MGVVKSFSKKSSHSPLGICAGIGNHKGGVGKSTNAVHIAAGLGEKGYSCLIVDLDPTAGATRLLGVDGTRLSGTLELLTEEIDPRELIVDNNLPKNVHLIPSRTELADIDLILNRYTDKLRILKAPINALRKSYDYIIVDTPPQPGSSLLACTYAVLEWFLLSVHAEPLALAGLSETLKDVAEVRKNLNPNLEILGILISRVKRSSSYWKEIASYIDETLPGRGFSVQISDTVQIQRASQEGITAFEHPKLSKQKIVKEYRELVNEIEYRTLNREKFLRQTKVPLVNRKIANS